jgi:hypothetical protein
MILQKRICLAASIAGFVAIFSSQLMTQKRNFLEESRIALKKYENYPIQKITSQTKSATKPDSKISQWQRIVWSACKGLGKTYLTYHKCIFDLKVKNALEETEKNLSPTTAPIGVYLKSMLMQAGYFALFAGIIEFSHAMIIQGNLGATASKLQSKKYNDKQEIICLLASDFFEQVARESIKKNTSFFYKLQSFLSKKDHKKLRLNFLTTKGVNSALSLVETEQAFQAAVKDAKLEGKLETLHTVLKSSEISKTNCTTELLWNLACKKKLEKIKEKKNPWWTAMINTTSATLKFLVQTSAIKVVKAYMLKNT